MYLVTYLLNRGEGEMESNIMIMIIIDTFLQNQNEFFFGRVKLLHSSSKPMNKCRGIIYYL